MADKYPTPNDAAGIMGKLFSFEKIALKMAQTKDEEELKVANEELTQLAHALDAEVKAFERKFAEAIRESEAGSPKHNVKLTPEQVEYVHKMTGETLGFVEVDAPPPGETLPLTYDEVTFLALQVAKAQAEQRKQAAAMKKEQRKAEEALRRAEEERRQAFAEIAARDPEAAARLERGGQ